MITNALTVDVEDYFQVNAFSDVIHCEDWDTFKPRVEKNTYSILDILDSIEVDQSSQFTVHGSQLAASKDNTNQMSNKACDQCLESNPNNEQIFNIQQQTTNHGRHKKVRGTFFILGWIAERFPHIVKEIHARGHEVACHGYSHKLIFNQTNEEFRDDVRRAKQLLEHLIGNEVIGYRAPTYSITQTTLWALEILQELGFKYDSSIFPIKHDVYGIPESPRFPYIISFNEKRGSLTDISQKINFDLKVYKASNRSIIEVPMSTVQMFKKNVPASGGGYFRLFPYLLTKRLLRSINDNEGKPFVFYLHPWEIDPEIPKINNASALSRFRTYVNLDKTLARFKRLLLDFHFASLSEVLFSQPINSTNSKRYSTWSD
jgi:polysaccharide deacetylase family protein (PEP-CTERM system associated)